MDSAECLSARLEIRQLFTGRGAPEYGIAVRKAPKLPNDFPMAICVGEEFLEHWPKVQRSARNQPPEELD